MFAPSSRYAAVGTYQVTLADGTVVTVTRIPARPPGQVLGWHRRDAEERLDLVAYRYLGDPTAAWVLCDANNAMVPEALAARDLIGIPPGGP
jgi:hypothetical protein